MFQYNLRTLLLVMLAACLLTWLFFVLPGEVGVAVLMCLFAVVPSAVIAGILYFRGIPQAFAIGCVPPLMIFTCLLVFDGPPWRFGPSASFEVKFMILVCLLVVAGGGAASASVRWLAAWSRQPQLETKSFPGLPLDLGQPASTAHGSAAVSSTPER
ncbi:MAG: hypothetical protein L0211_02260 [Planctomycetaceae bacterium]|nr:hypothetical protein [Planctomycetaceae bacterium]